MGAKHWLTGLGKGEQTRWWAEMDETNCGTFCFQGWSGSDNQPPTNVNGVWKYYMMIGWHS